MLQIRGERQKTIRHKVPDESTWRNYVQTRDQTNNHTGGAMPVVQIYSENFTTNLESIKINKPIALSQDKRIDSK